MNLEEMLSLPEESASLPEVIEFGPFQKIKITSKEKIVEAIIKILISKAQILEKKNLNVYDFPKFPEEEPIIHFGRRDGKNYVGFRRFNNCSIVNESLPLPSGILYDTLLRFEFSHLIIIYCFSQIIN
ncbi:MAG: hypothetical protein ABH830_02900 [Patescibacteria group bacterium]